VTQSEKIRATAESSGHSVYSDTGKSLATVKEAIEAINSSDEFLIGVPQNIEEFREAREIRSPREFYACSRTSRQKRVQLIRS
jgi:hypothetical protein